MRRTSIILLFLIAAIPAYASTVHSSSIVYLDGDAPTTTIVQLRPGDYAKISMPWDVTFSSTHGDDENRDSEIIAGTVDVHVHLRDDNVVLTITDGGKEVYHRVLARQNGWVWMSQHSKGAVAVELILTCNGVLQIYDADRLAYSVNGLSTSTTLDVLGDKDAEPIANGAYTHCSSSPGDYSGIGKMPRNDKLLVAALGLGAAVGTIGLVAAAGRR